MDLTARLDNDKRMAFRNGGGPPKSEEQEIAELMMLGINHPARRRHREREQRKQLEIREKTWNSSPLRPRPADLHGLKPITSEPWAIDEAFYQQKTGSFEHDYNAREPYDDRSTHFVRIPTLAEFTRDR